MIATWKAAFRHVAAGNGLFIARLSQPRSHIGKERTRPPKGAEDLPVGNDPPVWNTPIQADDYTT